MLIAFKVLNLLPDTAEIKQCNENGHSFQPEQNNCSFEELSPIFKMKSF